MLVNVTASGNLVLKLPYNLVESQFKNVGYFDDSL